MMFLFENFWCCQTGIVGFILFLKFDLYCSIFVCGFVVLLYVILMLIV